MNIVESSGTLPIRKILLAGLLTGITDGLFSSVLSVAFYHSSVTRLFRGVASVLLGAEALKGGTPIVTLGMLMHLRWPSGGAFYFRYSSCACPGYEGY